MSVELVFVVMPIASIVAAIYLMVSLERRRR